MSVAAGETFLFQNALPGEPAGGNHLSVVLSDEQYNQRTGWPITAPLRRPPIKAYRTLIARNEYQPQGPGLPLDVDRVIDLGQLCAVQIQQLGLIHGRVNDSALDRALMAIPRQLQLGHPPWQRRGEIWQCVVQGQQTQIVLVSNDAALANIQQQQYLALPYAAVTQEAPLRMIGKNELTSRVAKLADADQHALDQLLLQAFALEFDVTP